MVLFMVLSVLIADSDVRADARADVQADGAISVYQCTCKGCLQSICYIKFSGVNK